MAGKKAQGNGSSKGTIATIARALTALLEHPNPVVSDAAAKALVSEARRTARRQSDLRPELLFYLELTAEGYAAEVFDLNEAVAGLRGVVIEAREASRAATDATLKAAVQALARERKPGRPKRQEASGAREEAVHAVFCELGIASGGPSATRQIMRRASRMPPEVAAALRKIKNRTTRPQ